jgi:hypothetical protein
LAAKGAAADLVIACRAINPSWEESKIDAGKTRRYPVIIFAGVARLRIIKREE